MVQKMHFITACKFCKEEEDNIMTDIFNVKD